MRPRHALLLAVALPLLGGPTLIPGAARAQPAFAAASDGAEDLLRMAREAVTAGRAAQARDYLEQAETRILTRSVIATQAGTPAQGGAVGEVAAARQAVDRRDRSAAYRHIDQAMARLQAPPLQAAAPMASKAEDMGTGAAPRVLGPTPAPMFTPGLLRGPTEAPGRR